jgi:glycosyltransferase involved in cell wall biosynthesis
MSEAPLPAVSMIIPAYRRTDLLRKAIASGLNQDLPADQYEIIVVDSSPDDANWQLVESLKPLARCRLLCLRKPPEGPGPSRNLGATEARGKYLAFMDSDCQAAPGWLRHGIAAFTAGVGLVQGRTLPEPGVKYRVLQRSFRIEAENFIYHALNIFYRRDVFLDSGGFRAEPEATGMYVMGGEDVDLAWRIKRSGWHSAFAVDALVTHVVERITVVQWLFDKRLYVLPRVVRDHPEVRRFFFARYFFDQAQAALVLLLAGLFGTLLSPWTPVLGLPYVLLRGSEQTRALRGPLRLLRVLCYLPRDMSSLLVLAAGSLRYRRLLL